MDAETENGEFILKLVNIGSVGTELGATSGPLKKSSDSEWSRSILFNGFRASLLAGVDRNRCFSPPRVCLSVCLSVPGKRNRYPKPIAEQICLFSVSDRYFPTFDMNRIAFMRTHRCFMPSSLYPHGWLSISSFSLLCFSLHLGMSECPSRSEFACLCVFG